MENNFAALSYQLRDQTKVKRMCLTYLDLALNLVLFPRYLDSVWQYVQGKSAKYKLEEMDLISGMGQCYTYYIYTSNQS